MSGTNDMLLWMAKRQGYVPQGCRLQGEVVMGLVTKGERPCDGCNNSRELCGGKPKALEKTE